MGLEVLGSRIKQCRNDMYLTQKQFAKKLGVSNNVITRWENESNDPSATNLYSIAELCGVSTDWLLGREENDE